MRLIALFMAMLSLNVFAHEVQTITQHLSLRRTDQVGWLQEIIGRAEVNEKYDVGLQASYLERFDLFEKRLGGFLIYRPNEKWTFEGRYLQGMGNEILPEKQAIASAYFAYGNGLSPFVYYRDSRYTVTHLHTLNAGIEIEKIDNWIIIPSAMFGKATFKSPGKTDDVHNYGLRVVYYRENKFAVSGWTYKGKEASQGIIGQSTILIDTLSGGLGFAWFFTDKFKSELQFDHTDYDQLKTEFHTTTLNLSWMF